MVFQNRGKKRFKKVHRIEHTTPFEQIIIRPHGIFSKILSHMYVQGYTYVHVYCMCLCVRMSVVCVCVYVFVCAYERGVCVLCVCVCIFIM